MDRDRAIRKVLACLRLANSSNPHEAAAAMRQARALMDKFGLTEADATASEIGEKTVGTRCRGGALPASLLMLSSLVARGYRCRVVISRRTGLQWAGVAGKTELRFYGAGADPEVASYAYTVLRRQLESARKQHCARIRKAANRERRGEEFALGWLHAVAALFPTAELPEGREAAIEHAISTRLGQVTTAEPRALAKGGRAREDDAARGYAAGRGVQLLDGVAGEGQRRIEHA